jgi:hypothetical protein
VRVPQKLEQTSVSSPHASEAVIEQVATAASKSELLPEAEEDCAAVIEEAVEVEVATAASKPHFLPAVEVKCPSASGSDDAPQADTAGVEKHVQRAARMREVEVLLESVGGGDRRCHTAPLVLGPQPGPGVLDPGCLQSIREELDAAAAAAKQRFKDGVCLSYLVFARSRVCNYCAM